MRNALKYVGACVVWIVAVVVGIWVGGTLGAAISDGLQWPGALLGALAMIYVVLKLSGERLDPF